MIINDVDLAIVCENPCCTSQAAYIMKILRFGCNEYRLYCGPCTARLINGASEVLARHGVNEPVEDFFRAERLLTGACI